MRLARIALSSIVLGFVSISHAATLRVPQQFSTIQAAVNVAAAGDTVLVGPGRYVENLFVQKSLTLRSTRGAARTTIDGDGRGGTIAVLGTGTESVSISGFTITGGGSPFEPSLDYPSSRGAGVYVDTIANLTVTDSVVSGNSGCSGDGIVAFNSSAEISDNVVRNNDPMDWCSGSGSTIRLIGAPEYSSVAKVEGNQVTDNLGLAISVGFFDSIVIRGNRVSRNGVPLENLPTGAGISVGQVRTQAQISDNWISENVASSGAALGAGALSDPVSRVVITGNIIVDNVSDLGVGAEGDVTLFLMSPSEMIFRGNIVIGSTPGAMVYCSWDNVSMEGNVLINRDPAGTPHFCNH